MGSLRREMHGALQRRLRSALWRVGRGAARRRGRDSLADDFRAGKEALHELDVLLDELCFYAVVLES